MSASLRWLCGSGIKSEWLNAACCGCFLSRDIHRSSFSIYSSVRLTVKYIWLLSSVCFGLVWFHWPIHVSLIYVCHHRICSHIFVQYQCWFWLCNLYLISVTFQFSSSRRTQRRRSEVCISTHQHIAIATHIIITYMTRNCRCNRAAVGH